MILLTEYAETTPKTTESASAKYRIKRTDDMYKEQQIVCRVAVQRQLSSNSHYGQNPGKTGDFRARTAWAVRWAATERSRMSKLQGQPGGLAEGSRWSFRAKGGTTTGKPYRIVEHPGGVPEVGDIATRSLEPAPQ